MVRLISKIAECAGIVLRHRDFAALDTIVIHRIGVAGSATLISRWFKRNFPQWGMPYPVIVLADGDVEQAVPLSRITHHALIWNRRSIAVAVVKDKGEPVTSKQWRGLVWAVAELKRQFPNVFIEPHDGLRGGSNDKDKVCPDLDMDKLRCDVDAEIGNQCSLERFII